VSAVAQPVGEPLSDAYDAIVVGAGLGGLSAGAMLAKAGRKVLVVEQADAPGGYAHSFTRGPYRFDPAVHFTVQAAEGGLLDLLLRLLGVRDRCMLMPHGSLYEARFPGLCVRVPANKEAFITEHARNFPDEADGIRAFVDLVETLTEESQEVGANVSLRQLDAASAQYPTLFRWRRATLAEALDEHLRDPRLKALCAASWPYAGLPPSRLSFLTWAAMLMAMLDDGPFQVRGGFQALVDALVEALEDHGGELVVSRGVARIEIGDGRATGVTLAGGRSIRASVVVANADARQTFERLVGAEHLPAGFVRRLGRLEPALSACIGFAATALDLRQLAPAHETFLHHSWDHEETYRGVQGGGLGGMWVTLPTLFDPSLAPPGEHIAIITSHMPFDLGAPWSELRDHFGELLLGELDRMFPGFSDNLRHFEVGTPQTLARYASNDRGAMYGWANTPSQATSQRLAHRTPIDGLLLAGHWAQPGSGSLRAIYSGLHAAHHVLGHPHVDSLLEADVTGMFVVDELSGMAR
jgi:phytoene dehydrogenase-like protein